MNTIDEAINELVSGKVIIVMDDEDRENEGDLIASSELCTPETVNFMSSKAKGLICVSITEDRAEELKLNLMVNESSARHNTKFTVSVDYAHKTSTGISAHDRAATIRALAYTGTKPDDLLRPGHIFPLVAVREGVLRRAGHTEATIDLMRLAGLKPCGVLCEIIKEDGTMARRKELEEFAKEYDLKMITVKDLISYRMSKEKLVEVIAQTVLPTEWGTFDLRIYQNKVDGMEHLALSKGTWTEEEPVLVRVHSECLTGDAFSSLRCDCGNQLHTAMKKIDEEGKGILLYMRQEGRGIGLVNKIKAYALQDDGMDTVEANEHLGFAPDPRDYGIGAQILRDLGVRKMNLLTNNPKKRVGLEGYELEVNELIPLEIPANEANIKYLSTKKYKMGHILHNL